MMWRDNADTWFWGLSVRAQALMLAGALAPWCWLGAVLASEFGR
jgi:hypothetical protein